MSIADQIVELWQHWRGQKVTPENRQAVENDVRAGATLADYQEAIARCSREAGGHFTPGRLFREVRDVVVARHQLAENTYTAEAKRPPATYRGWPVGPNQPTGAYLGWIATLRRFGTAGVAEKTARRYVDNDLVLQPHADRVLADPDAVEQINRDLRKWANVPAANYIAAVRRQQEGSAL